MSEARRRKGAKKWAHLAVHPSWQVTSQAMRPRQRPEQAPVMAPVAEALDQTRQSRRLGATAPPMAMPMKR